MTNALGRYWTYDYNLGGGCCGDGMGTNTVIDPLGREITSVTSPSGLPSKIIRRASAGATGANAVTNSTTYLAGMISPEQEAEEYPATVTDEGGRVRRFEYTSLGQLKRATELSGSTWWTNQYDSANGALTNVLSPTGAKRCQKGVSPGYWRIMG